MKDHHTLYQRQYTNALKTIERANPSIVILEKGTVKQKAHYNDIEGLKL